MCRKPNPSLRHGSFPRVCRSWGRCGERLRVAVEIQVNQANAAALKIYLRCGFREVRRASWNPDFIVLRAEL